MRTTFDKIALAAAGAALALAAAAATSEARAADPIKVVTTLTHLAAHAREVGGDRVQVQSLGSAGQDPHFIQPTPALMVKANAADSYVEVGLELELWSEHVIDGARNANVRIGSPGHIFAAAGVPVLERPTTISRAQGDVHPNGNPHIWLDPTNAVIEAQNIAEGLKLIDRAGAADYDARFKAYKAKLEKAYFGEELVRLLGADTLTGLAQKGNLHSFLETKKYKGAPLSDKVGGWLKVLWPYRGAKLITYHREWTYFAHAFDLEVVNTLEPKPGIPPTPGHLTELEKLAASTKIGAVVAAPYYNVGLAESFAERVHVPLLVSETEPDDRDGKADYVAYMDKVVDEMAKTLARGGGK